MTIQIIKKGPLWALFALKWEVANQFAKNADSESDALLDIGMLVATY